MINFFAFSHYNCPICLLFQVMVLTRSNFSLAESIIANICKMMYFTVYLLLASVCLVGSVQKKTEQFVQDS